MNSLAYSLPLLLLRAILRIIPPKEAGVIVAVYVPTGQPTQIVGQPALSDETYRRLGEDMKVIYQRYQAMLKQAADDKEQP